MVKTRWGGQRYAPARGAATPPVNAVELDHGNQAVYRGRAFAAGLSPSSNGGSSPVGRITVNGAHLLFTGELSAGKISLLGGFYKWRHLSETWKVLFGHAISLIDDALQHGTKDPRFVDRDTGARCGRIVAGAYVR